MIKVYLAKQKLFKSLLLETLEVLTFLIPIKLSGTQTAGSGIDAFDNYVTGSGWQTYEIPVGDFFTGDFNHLTFVNDHDVSNSTGSSALRNIRLFEA